MRGAVADLAYRFCIKFGVIPSPIITFNRSDLDTEKNGKRPEVANRYTTVQDKSENFLMQRCDGQLPLRAGIQSFTPRTQSHAVCESSLNYR